MMHLTLSAGRTLALTALLILVPLARCALLAADVALPNGVPDPDCPELRLWLRADAGVHDAAGRSSSDPAFSGSVAAWSDQSGRHFDLAAPPEKAPAYVVSQPAAGNRPTLAFGSGRMLVRANEALHEQANSTTFLVLQIQRGRDAGNVVYCAGDPGGKRDLLCFQRVSEAEAARGFLQWWSATQNGQINVDNPLPLAADSRFAIVVLQSAGENSFLEVHDGLGDALGAHRETLPAGQSAASNQCGRGYCLGGPKLDQPQSAYDGEIAEVLVYNRVLSSAQRRALVSYLRRKYELDVLDALYPAGTMLLQAEDFDGPWQISSRWDQQALALCLGQRQFVSKSDKPDEGIKRTVLVSQPGNYSVWLRAFGSGPESGLRTSVGGKPLGVTHAKGPLAVSWQLAGKIDLPAGETEIAVRGEGPGRKACDALLLSRSITTQAGVEEICALARRLHQAPGSGRLVAVFDDGRRFEGSLVSGWRGSGTPIARTGGVRPAVRCLRLDGLITDAAQSSDAVLEFHNGDRIRGSVCGYAAAPTQPGQSGGPQVLVQPSADFHRSSSKPIAVDIDWLRRIVFDTAGPPRGCPPRALVCRDGRVIGFRVLRFNGEGLIALTDQGLVRLAYRELAEVVMPPMDPWEAYYRQLAAIDPDGDAGIIRLEVGQGMVLTASVPRAMSFRQEGESAASTYLMLPAWSRTPIPLAWFAVRTLWRAPATVVPLSLFAPQAVAQRGALGSSWKWQVDRNVAGGELRSGGDGYLWGFGVHAPNELVFRLPESAQAFRCGLGIDSAVGDSGCVVGKVYLNEAPGTPAFQSKLLAGSQATVSSGDIALARGNVAARQLVLVVEDGGETRGPVAAPLDIGDHADWLEPTLVLDPVKLHATVEKYRRTPK
jgi:hypothetical protein